MESQEVRLCSALATAEGWVDHWGVPFKGVGEYQLEDGSRVVIKKDKKISPPADYDASKAHVSVKKYAYGQMFFGEFYGVPKLNFRYPPKPRRLYLKPTLFEKACQKIYQIYQFIKTLLIGE